MEDFFTFKHFFSFEGRMNRLKYLVSRLFLIVVQSVSFGLSVFFIIFGGALLVEINNTSWPFGETAFILVFIFLVFLALAFFMVTLVSTFASMVRRLHDIGWSGWFSILFLIPFINFIYELVVLFKKGSPDPNKYGPVPPRFDF